MKTFDNLDSFLRSLFPSATAVTLGDASGLTGVSSERELATVELGDGERREVFVKVCRKGSMPAVSNSLAHTMDKEIEFYERVLPKMKKFCEQRGKNDSPCLWKLDVPYCEYTV